MGGCATKPRVLESEEAPVETPVPAADAAPATTEKVETILQERESGGETKEVPLVDVTETKEEPQVDVTETKEEHLVNVTETKEEPLVDVTVVVPEAPKEEATTKAEEVKPAAEAEAEEKKEVTEPVATPEVSKAAETVVTTEAPKA